MRFNAGVVALVLCACARPSESAPVTVEGGITINVNLPNTTFSLPNGLVVVLHQESTAAAVHVHVRYDVGARDDPAGRSGLAHLVEHLMFRPSKHGGQRDYMQWMAACAGEANGTTSSDTTDYFATLPPSELATALWLESDRMAYPLARLDDALFTTERDVVLNEWRQRYENVDYGQVELLARAALFAGTPYERPPIGRIDELQAASLTDAQAFARTYYRPHNATLVIAGAFDVPVAQELVTRYFGSIAPGSPSPRVAPPAAPVGKKSASVRVAADVPMAMITVAWAGPGVHAPGYQELEYGFDVFCWDVLQKLTVGKKLAHRVDCDVDPARLASEPMLEVTIEPGTSVDAVLSIVEEELARAKHLGRAHAWGNFSEFQRREVLASTTTLETLTGRTAQLLHGLEYHGAADSVRTDLGAILAVHPSNVGAAVEQFLLNGSRVTVVVTPTPGAPRAGRVVQR
jgi:predicted Zn-dependent peptidase